MARLTPDQIAQKWQRNLSAAGPDITNGVNNVTVAPGTLAARNVDAWYANVTAAKDKWARRVASVTLDDWKNAMLTVGVQRVSQGAQAKSGKVAAFAQEFLPFLDRVTAATKAMPNVTLEDRIARMNAQVRGVAGFKRGGTQ